MMKIWIAGALAVSFGTTGVVHLGNLKQRIDELDRQRENVPAAIALQDGLESLRAELSQMGVAIQTLRDLQEASAVQSGELEQLEQLEQRFEEALCEVVARQQQIETAAVEPGAPADVITRVDDLERGVRDLETGVHDMLDERWTGITSEVSTAVGLAKEAQMEIDQLSRGLERDTGGLWRDMVGPTVQLAGETTVGSGVLLPSRPVKAAEGDSTRYETLLITSWHVVRDIRADARIEDPPIPVSIYAEGGGIWFETARLVAHDVDLDAALLQLTTDEPVSCGAMLATREELEATTIFDEVVAVGCPLGNDPIPTRGEMIDTHHRVDGKSYWMISAPTYIGNSGGGIFDGRSHHLMGIFSKIYTHGSLRPTVVPHMGLVTPLLQIYDWLEEESIAKVVDSGDGAYLVLVN